MTSCGVIVVRHGVGRGEAVVFGIAGRCRVVKALACCSGFCCYCFGSSFHELLDACLITPEEYESKRAAIIGGL